VHGVVDGADVNLECHGRQHGALAALAQRLDLGVNGVVAHTEIIGVTPT
jgi:hypothetical protein